MQLGYRVGDDATCFNSQQEQEDTLLKSVHTGCGATQPSLQWVEGCKPATASQ